MFIQHLFDLWMPRFILSDFDSTSFECSHLLFFMLVIFHMLVLHTIFLVIDMGFLIEDGGGTHRRGALV